MRTADRLGRGFREAEIADLALADERRHGADRLLDRRLRVHPVLVIEVDDLDAEAAKASLAAAPHIVCRALHAHEASIGLAQDAELGREHDLVSTAGDGLADELLVVPLPVDIRGVQEADAELDGAMEGGDGFTLIARAIELAHAHAAETERRDLQAHTSKLARFHVCRPFNRSARR
jgi:hypothetical protein